MVIKCVICRQSMQEHDADCPQGIMEALYQVHGPIQCPKCRKQKVYKNRMDYYECAECKKVFCTGIAAGYDVDKLPAVLICPRNGNETMAVVLPEEGTGDIPILERFEELSSDIDRERKIYRMIHLYRYQLLRDEMLKAREEKAASREERLLALMDDAWKELDDDQIKELEKEK